MQVESEFNAARSAAANGEGVSDETVTMARIERAIHIVADMMVKHNRPRLIVHIRRLEAELDRLRNETDPMAYAKQILSKCA
jgi:hypothetical protein